MTLKMSTDEKPSGTEPGTEPTVIMTTSANPDVKPRSRLTKKHVLMAVVSLLITGLLVTAVLVSIRIFTDNNLEVLKYTLKAEGVKQNVSTSENSVIFHVVKDSVEAWIVQDFDTSLQISKVQADGKTTCYVTALNRSVAAEPSAIPSTAPDVNSKSPTSKVVYKIVPEPIPNISFLGKKGSALCLNIPTYHAIPDCDKAPDDNIVSGAQNSTSGDHRIKRTPAFCATYRGFLCACGCCSIVCGNFASTQYVCSYYYGMWHCTYYMRYVYAYGSLYGCRYNGRYYNP